MAYHEVMTQHNFKLLQTGRTSTKICALISKIDIGGEQSTVHVIFQEKVNSFISMIVKVYLVVWLLMKQRLGTAIIDRNLKVVTQNLRSQLKKGNTNHTSRGVMLHFM